MQKVCSPRCAITLTNQAKLKERKKQTRKQKDAAKTHGALTTEAQAAVNAFIRVRDRGKPCISCSKKRLTKVNAGHFRAVGGCRDLRFNTFNIHLQCEYCNNYLSGNQLEYRKALVLKYGEDRVQWLEGPHESKSYTKDELRRIKKIFNKRKRIYDMF